ncbi:hypothetical protein U1Q18_024202 [Sarracenia purpurea var. burkii]
MELMCNYDDMIELWSRDHQLDYIDGHAKILAIDPRIKIVDILVKDFKICYSKLASSYSMFFSQVLDTIMAASCHHCCYGFSTKLTSPTTPTKLARRPTF